MAAFLRSRHRRVEVHDLAAAPLERWLLGAQDERVQLLLKQLRAREEELAALRETLGIRVLSVGGDATMEALMGGLGYSGNNGEAEEPEPGRKSPQSP